MTSGLVNASFSLPKGQAVKMIFFAPCTVTNGPEKFGHNNQVTRINEVAIRWGSTVPLPANTAVIQLSLLASDGSQANHI